MHGHERLLDDVAHDDLRRVVAARRLPAAAATSQVDGACGDRDVVVLGGRDVRVLGCVVGEVLARAVGLEREQALVHVAEVTDVEVGVVDPAGVVVVVVDGQLVKRPADARVGRAYTGEDRACRRLRIVMEEPAVVRRHSPLALAAAIAPKVSSRSLQMSRAFSSKLALGLDRGDDRVEPPAQRVRLVARRNLDWQVLARFRVQDEEKPVEEDRAWPRRHPRAPPATPAARRAARARRQSRATMAGTTLS